MIERLPRFIEFSLGVYNFNIGRVSKVILDQQENSETMSHTREDVIDRTIREFELLDHLVAGLSNEDWE